MHTGLRRIREKEHSGLHMNIRVLECIRAIFFPKQHGESFVVPCLHLFLGLIVRLGSFNIFVVLFNRPVSLRID
jgi:hypothetical protein